MRTDSKEGGTPTGGRRGWRVRFIAWMERPSSPFAFVALAAAGFWVFEATVHANVTHDFIGELLLPDSHELWLRLVVTGMVSFIGYAWRIALLERQEGLRALESYQRRLQDLTTELAYADAEERRLFARRLHESVGQQLAAARLFLASIDDKELSDASALQSASRIVDRVTTEVRELAEDLSPAALDEFGLATALPSLARRIMLRSGVSIDVEMESCGGVEGDAARVAFQVAAEVLEHAVRHAEANKVAVRCFDRQECVAIELVWKGRVPADLFSQAERMSGIGGALIATPDAGAACVILLVPHAA